MNDWWNIISEDQPDAHVVDDEVSTGQKSMMRGKRGTDWKSVI
jgi:hypothetical protein